MAAGLVFTLLLGLSFGLWDGADASQLRAPTELDCPAGWSWFDYRCFAFMPYSMSWTTAEKHCLIYDSHLASYHSTEEYNFIRELIRKVSGKHSRIWVGGYDSAEEGTWLWSDGTKFLFTNWHVGEPSSGQKENCMNINYKEQDYVNDSLCGIQLPFICVIPA